MKLFGPLYERALIWARHPRAPLFLFLLSFGEAVIIPVPPEVMLQSATELQVRGRSIGPQTPVEKGAKTLMPLGN